MEGWTRELKEEFKGYYAKRDSLSVEDGCLFYGERIVVPEVLQQELLSLVHEGHIGVVRMKTLAKQYVYWMSMYKYIEEYIVDTVQMHNMRLYFDGNIYCRRIVLMK